MDRMFAKSDLHLARLEVLYQTCREQIARYRKDAAARRTSQSSDCCDEIVRRSCLQDREALGILLEISSQIAASQRGEASEGDFEQEVILRLLTQFNKRALVFHSFAAYRKYVNLTALCVKIDLFRSEKHLWEPGESLEEISSLTPSVEDQYYFQWLVDRCLEVLHRPLEREVFVRRYVHGEDVSEIVADLHMAWPDLKRQDVYDAAAVALRRVRKWLEKNSLWNF